MSPLPSCCVSMFVKMAGCGDDYYYNTEVAIIDTIKTLFCEMKDSNESVQDKS